PHPTVDAILRCLKVRNHDDYAALCKQFEAENAVHQEPQRRVEIERIPVLPDRVYIHDPHAMLIVPLLDDSGARLPDPNLLLTACPSGDHNQPTVGLLSDRHAIRLYAGHTASFTHC